MSNHLPHRIKEMVLAELRSVKAIQTDYAKVLDSMEKSLEAYKKSKGTPAEKQHIQQLKTLTAQKKKLAAELNDKVSDMYKDAELKVDEMNTTANADGYGTPFAFGKGEDEKTKGKRQADLTGYSVVNEAKTYKKGDKLKIKLKNGKKFDVVFVDYSRTKGIAYGKFKDGGEVETKPFSLDFIVESVNENKFNAYISSNDGKTFTIYNSNKEKVKNVSRKELEKLMRVNGNHSSTMNWNTFMGKFDKTTNLGKHWKYWKGNLINVTIPSIGENKSVNESHFKIGDKVKMSHGGVGIIKSLDKEDGADDEKYYGVELPNGEIHKHSPNELSSFK